jgi:hypothetical protein
MSSPRCPATLAWLQESPELLVIAVRSYEHLLEELVDLGGTAFPGCVLVRRCGFSSKDSPSDSGSAFSVHQFEGAER